RSEEKPNASTRTQVRELIHIDIVISFSVDIFTPFGVCTLFLAAETYK
ncbi:MAG: hypothetical protein UX13_C0015G0020, partial [Candidatus Woesebacteria bacterium GW2011_GWB1_45_5]